MALPKALERIVKIESQDSTFDGNKAFAKVIDGSINGNAATATSAVNDDQGRKISETYASAVSPSFTGDVIVPDVEANDNSSKAANTKFVQAAVASLVASAPEALDTLKELAEALNNDPNFATSLATQLGQKADDDAVVHLANTETITGTKTFTDTIVGSVSGNSGTTTKLASAVNVSIKDADGTHTGATVAFDGSSAIEIKLPEIIKGTFEGNISGSSGSCTGNAETASKATALDKAAIKKVSWAAAAAINGSDDSPATVTLPSGTSYVAGKNQILSLIYNGIYCIKEYNFKEVDAGTSIQLLFPATAGDLFEITILNTAD